MGGGVGGDGVDFAGFVLAMGNADRCERRMGNADFAGRIGGVRAFAVYFRLPFCGRFNCRHISLRGNYRRRRHQLFFVRTHSRRTSLGGIHPHRHRQNHPNNFRNAKTHDIVLFHHFHKSGGKKKNCYFLHFSNCRRIFLQS